MTAATRPGGCLRVLVFTLSLVTAACTPLPGGTACTEEARSGITLTVKHAITNADICDATVIATQGSFTETVQPSGGSPCTYAGLYERAGTYRVEVRKAGFITATEDNVTVTEDECHVNTVVRTVLLTPQ